MLPFPKPPFALNSNVPYISKTKLNSNVNRNSGPVVTRMIRAVVSTYIIVTLIERRPPKPSVSRVAPDEM